MGTVSHGTRASWSSPRARRQATSSRRTCAWRDAWDAERSSEWFARVRGASRRSVRTTSRRIAAEDVSGSMSPSRRSARRNNRWSSMRSGASPSGPSRCRSSMGAMRGGTGARSRSRSGATARAPGPVSARTTIRKRCSRSPTARSPTAGSWRPGGRSSRRPITCPPGIACAARCDGSTSARCSCWRAAPTGQHSAPSSTPCRRLAPCGGKRKGAVAGSSPIGARPRCRGRPSRR